MIICFYGILMLGHRMSFSNTMAQSLKIVDKNLKADATAVSYRMSSIVKKKKSVY